MKHLFYFKKNQKVPQWILRVRGNEDGKEVEAAIFRVNGKLLLDDTTGSVVIWPASKRHSCIIYIKATRSGIQADTGDERFINHLFGFYSYTSMSKKRIKRSPLANARGIGFNVHTSTKCQPLPANFNRIIGR